MDLSKVKKIVEEILPKVVDKYGFSKFAECTPYVEYERMTHGDTPHAEYDNITNSIIIYYPKMRSKKQIIQTLIHEYQHYLQSPSWMTRYYRMGYRYDNHPYEIAAYNEEVNWNKI